MMKKMAQIEKMAMLRLTEEKRSEMAAALQKLLEYADTMNQLDTEGVVPAVHLFREKSVLREDVLQDSLFSTVGIGHAPEQKTGCYVVPGTIHSREVDEHADS